MTLPPDIFSTPRDVLWRDRGPSRMTLEARGVFTAPSGSVELGDAAREEFVHETSLILPVPAGSADVELAVVHWDDDDPVQSRVAAVTLWWGTAESPESPVRWNRTALSVPVDSAVGLLVDATMTDKSIMPLSSSDVWPSVMAELARTGVRRIGEALLFDCGTAAADFPVWVALRGEGQVTGLRISTMLLDDSALAAET